MIRLAALNPACFSTITSCALCAKDSDHANPTGRVSKKGKNRCVIIEILIVNSYPSEASGRDAWKREPALQFSGHHHSVEAVVNVGLCYV